MRVRFAARPTWLAVRRMERAVSDEDPTLADFFARWTASEPDPPLSNTRARRRTWWSLGLIRKQQPAKVQHLARST